MKVIFWRIAHEECDRSEDMGEYFRVTPDERGLNYDKYLATYGSVTQADESYNSHNTTLLDVQGTIEKIMTTDYVRNQLKDLKK